MNKNLVLLLYVLAFVVLFATWAGVVFWQVDGADDLVAYIKSALAMLGGHVLTLINSQPSEVPK